MRLDFIVQHELQRGADDFILIYDEHPSLIDGLGCLNTYLHMLPRQQVTMTNPVRCTLLQIPFPAWMKRQNSIRRTPFRCGRRGPDLVLFLTEETDAVVFDTAPEISKQIEM
ncbi:hypothetical protein [Methylovirgula ligni]|uniref:hypothetical protein n=1 Tax=Methylovirgula ligni TaxID=569860 RepID=UPI0013EDF499|nr:hypothetical protein [Methylovirgula ligni]